MLNKEIVEISTLSFPGQCDNNQILIDENDIHILIENDEYIIENSDSSPIHYLNIQLGTDTLPRFSCACHKTN
jgi:hypothetical protein